MFLGLLGGGSGWFCAGYECFWGGNQWLSVVMGGYGDVFGVFLGGYGWFWAGFWLVMSGHGWLSGWQDLADFRRGQKWP